MTESSSSETNTLVRPVPTQFESRDFLANNTGMPFVYPGHPLVIATCILRTFDSFAEASARSGNHSYPEALTHSAIPGAGGEVYQALDFLKRILEGRLDPKEALSFASERWKQNGAGGHTEAVEPGIAQAAKLEEVFLTLLQKWPHLVETTKSA